VAEVEFLNAAETDLVEFDEFSASRFGEAVAEAYMHGFDEAFGLLRDFPLSALLNPDLGEGIRCLVHRQHRIFYQVGGDAVLIIRIVHYAMDARQALKGRGGVMYHWPNRHAGLVSASIGPQVRRVAL
jgi:toxin ParE1/3/4